MSVDGAAWQDVRPFNITHNVFGPTENPTFLDVGQPGNFHYSRWLFWAPANTIPTRSVTGIPTPSGGVPTVGAATYSGIMTGNTDAAYTDGLNTYPAQAFGTIALQFDFAAGTLAGTAKPSVYVGDITGTELPPVSFVDTVFLAGSTGFSGKFQTALPGPNAFSGLFTGPAANELIGKWTLPFQWTPDADSALTGDGQIHSIWGVFLAKR